MATAEAPDQRLLERWRAVFENVPYVITDFDRDGRILITNSFPGQKLSEVVGRIVYDIVPEHIDERGRLGHRLDVIEIEGIDVGEVVEHVGQLIGCAVEFGVAEREAGEPRYLRDRVGGDACGHERRGYRPHFLDNRSVLRADLPAQRDSVHKFRREVPSTAVLCADLPAQRDPAYKSRGGGGPV